MPAKTWDPDQGQGPTSLVKSIDSSTEDGRLTPSIRVKEYREYVVVVESDLGL